MNIEAVNQRDYGDAYCLASCYLAIANSFGNNLTMQDLRDEGIVASNGYVNRWGDYFTRGNVMTYNATKVKEALDNDNPVILKGTSSAGTHYVVAYSYSGSTIEVMDPWGGVFGDLGSTTLKKATNYYVCS